jgi:MOSC domain-containing protein YiiM
MGKLLHIFISPEIGDVMHSMNDIEAITDCGIKGDRYANPKNRKSPSNQITLIESENIRAFTQETGLPLPPDAPRRNLVTAGINLNQLCGKIFRVGEVVMEGLELCEPCSNFAKNTYPETLRFFVHRGGLNARIIRGGLLSIGAKIEECA